MNKPQTERRVQLRIKGGGDLHKFIFRDDQHARRWLGQSFAVKNGQAGRYTVAIVLVRESRVGDDVVTKVLQRMSVEEFLKQESK